MAADTRPVPLIILTCAECGASIPRPVARGLWISDGQAAVQAGFTQQCAECGHVHQPGSVMRYRIGGSLP